MDERWTTPLAEEISRMVWAFPLGDNRKEDVKDLADQAQELGEENARLREAVQFALSILPENCDVCDIQHSCWGCKLIEAHDKLADALDDEEERKIRQSLKEDSDE